MAHLKRLVAMQVVVMDWLVLGMPRSAPRSLCLGQKLSAAQWSVVRMLEFLIVDGNTPEFVDAATMGRSASKVEDFELHLDALSRMVASVHVGEPQYFGSSLTSSTKMELDNHVALRCGELVGRSSREVMVTAKPLIASRLSFPPPPKFDPCEFFDEPTRERYEKPRTVGKKPEDVDEVPPRVSVRADRINKVELYKKLADSGRLRPLRPGAFSKTYTSGLFSVTKDGLRDRLILDGRPANMLDRQQSRWCKAMATASSLTGLFIEPDRVLCASGEDLRDFFYQFTVNDERLHRNVLSDPISIGEALQIFGEVDDSFVEDGMVWVGLSTLAMGDCCSVEFSQCSHLSLLLKNDVAEINELLTLYSPPPRGLLQVGIAVDDLIVLEHYLRSHLPPENSEGSSRTAAAREAYRKVGLECNSKKAFADLTCSRFWGIELDGDKGLLRCSSLRLWPITVVTVRTCMLGLATIGLLEAIAGSWVSLLGVRRKLFSLLDIIFEPLSVKDQKAVVRLSDELKSELLAVAVMGSLAVVNLRAVFAPFVCATDASMGWMAAVRSPLPPKICQELSRHTIRKGLWSRLLNPNAALQRSHGQLAAEDEVPEDEEPYSMHPFWEILARSLTYTETWRKPVTKPSHINVLELKAHLYEERRLSASYRSMRIPYGLDSQVCLGAVVKGRSSSKALTYELKKSIPWAIGSDLYGLHMYYATQHNRADGPTRNSTPAPADMELPAWWDEAAAGYFFSFDKWCCDVGVPDVLSDLPFNEIGKFDIEQLESARVAKQKARVAACSRGVPEAKRKRSTKSDSCPSTLPTSIATPDETLSSTTADAGISASGSEISPATTGVCDVKFKTARVRALLDGFNKNQFLFHQASHGKIAVKGGLDLYTGKGGVARAMIRKGAPWILSFEILRSASEDLLDPQLQEVIKELLESDVFATVVMAPVCSSYSIAVTPPVRSRRHPRGLPGLRISMRQKVRTGNLHSDFVISVVAICIAGEIWYFIENPDTSFMWHQKGWERYVEPTSPSVFRCCFCRFGTSWKKPTKFGTNTSLGGTKMWCVCKTKHVQLRGMHPERKIARTLVAQPYPRGLCNLLADTLCSNYGWCNMSKLDIGRCAKCSSKRIGEAANPGPVRSQAVSLEEVQVLSFETRQLEARLLREFLVWSSTFLGRSETEEIFDKVPMFLVQSLRCYGDLMFQRGGALSNLRHLLLACQRWKPMSRPLMASAWDLVERWESICPVKHRTPIPEALVKALCVYGWHQRWYSWVGATLLAFYGAGRLGEILKTTREDLVLPSDVLEPPGSPIFLRLRRFKSLGRQPAKIQHMKVIDRKACSIIITIFKNLDYEAPLFGTTAYQYRKRWNIAIQCLCGAKGSHLTPGGLRGGAAVHHYKAGRHIGDLLWLLRLRSQSTLESYLQEVAALNVLAAFTPKARESILLMASFFAFL